MFVLYNCHQQLQRVHENSSVCNFVAVGFLDVEQGYIDKNLANSEKMQGSKSQVVRKNVLLTSNGPNNL